MQTIAQSGGDCEITGVQYDSRCVQPGDLFVAMKGETTDGNRFIGPALALGAVAVVTDSRESFEHIRDGRPDIQVALVAHGRRALAEVSAAVYGHPEQQLAISAVTGTNGKTTTAYLLEQMLRSVGRTSVLLGTIENHIGDEVRESIHTTPESRDLFELFAEGVAVGATEVVMEMSSHALDQERVWGVPVDVAIFTNLTQDHLDYHKTMQQYFEAKSKLFSGVGTPAPRVAVINADDDYGGAMEGAARGSEQMLYGTGDYAEYRAESMEIRAGSTKFQFVTPKGSIAIASPLTGRVNVYNLLAASCAALARGLSFEEIAAATAQLKQVPGRFQVVHGTAPFAVVVDYAHTDDALRNLITLARELVEPTSGRVITLFGCGGDRDRTKRPKMGAVAAELSDFVIVTSDNPRTEDPQSIIDEVLTGISDSSTARAVEIDRHTAIELAISGAHPGDIVLIAGKGHEKVQILREGTVPFDDVAEAERALRERGY